MTTRAPVADPLTYTVEEASRVMLISRTTCYEWVRSGVLPAIHRGRVIRIPKRSLEAWMEAESLRNGEDQR